MLRDRDVHAACDAKEIVMCMQNCDEPRAGLVVTVLPGPSEKDPEEGPCEPHGQKPEHITLP